MNALDLIMLGRRLTKIGEEVMRGSGRPAGAPGGTAGPTGGTAGAPGAPEGTAGAPGGTAGAPFMPAGPSLVLRDVFAHPDSSISDVTARTGLPQSYVSESVARLRGQGILETSPDPADGRRTLVRVSAEHPRTVAAKGSASVDAALAAALDDAADAGEIIDMLSDLAERLRPEPPGPIQRRLDQARNEP